jgi:predicted small secreted protein
MDTATLIAGVAACLNIVFGVLAYLMKDKLESTTQRLREAEEAIVDIKVNYAHKADVHAMKQEILSRFDRLEDKLTKAN